MIIETLEIHGLRGFSNNGTLQLALPNGEPGSGITILVGPNSGGKSTIVEALRAFSTTNATSFSEDKRNSKANQKITIAIKTKNQSEKKILSTNASGGSETIFNKTELQPSHNNILVLPSRRYFNLFNGKSTTGREQYAQSISTLDRNSAITTFFHRLCTIAQDEQKKEKFNQYLSKVIDPLPHWFIELSSHNQYYIKLEYDGINHNSEGAGDGLISLFFIIDALYDSQRGQTIVIDEPELSLHPALKRKLLELFKELSKDRQIIYTTHSPYFVDFESIANGAHLARIFKHNNSSTIHNLSQQSREEITGFLKDIHNPHVLGLDAREVFFLEDNVILTEGQEDVVSYKKIANQLNKPWSGSFFGWGTGGAEKMEIFVKILQDLGFKKLVGILDNDKKLLCDKLTNAYKNYLYLFICIPTNDIKDKTAENKPQKSGLVTSNGQLKPDYLDAINTIIDQINNHFNPSKKSSSQALSDKYFPQSASPTETDLSTINQ